MKDQLKIGLLIVVAALTAINTSLLLKGNGSSSSKHDVVSEASSPTNDAAGHEGHDHDAAPSTLPTVDPSAPKTTMVFGEIAHEFGEIDQNTENKHVFAFTNTGDNPLIIEDAKGSCGCTVPEYPKEPIAPGATGEIVVVYKPGRQKGNQNKTVTLTANTEERTTVLNISANVNEVPVEDSEELAPIGE